MNTNTERSGCLTAFLKILGFNIPKQKNLTSPFLLKNSLHSNAELSFHHCLVSAVEDRYFLATKVRMLDVFYPKKGDEHQSNLNRINRKHIDFLLCCKKTMTPLLIIELDDSTHQTNQRTIKRDEFIDEICEATGLPILHIRAAKTYVISELRTQIDSLVEHRMTVGNELPQLKPNIEAPLCPQCQSEMKLRTATKGKQKGTQFWGCQNYPNCKSILPIGN
ncbi:MAG: DUF2726 domain-containing protein [Planctomycetaceae bacterium]|nr:DUF2726 domain-containing protein [Planctomycetaceae bacterium]